MMYKTLHCPWTILITDMIMTTVIIRFESSNDCTQDGEKYTVAINNEYFTLGRTQDNREYFTGDWLSYSMKAVQTIQE